MVSIRGRFVNRPYLRTVHIRPPRSET